MTATTPFYKVLVNGSSAHGGSLQWSLPIEHGLGGGWIPGRWHTVKRALEPCRNGLHVCTWEQVWNQWIKIDADVYEVETRGKVIHDTNKSVARSVRLLRPVDFPDWWVKTREEIASFKDIKWLQPDGDPLPEWRLFTANSWVAARAAAGAAAWAAARAAARAAAWDAAWDAALNTTLNVACADLPIDQKHRDHAAKRWQVWRKGWAVLCDVNGILYVYAKAGR